jgi:hypothetical protein
MNFFLKLFPSLVAAVVLAIATDYYLVTLPQQHQEALRIKAEQACQDMLNHNDVNIAGPDQSDWKRRCMDDKLSL